MSWSHPTASEAEEYYSYYKKRYNEAAIQKKASENKEENYRSQKNSNKAQIKNMKSQKINFEKRIEDIEKIIKMLEGGSFVFNDVPEKISKANSKLDNVGESYLKSVKVTGGGSKASFESAFSVKSVQADSYSAAALQQLKKEKTRVEQEINNMSKKINSLTASIDELNKKINSCNNYQRTLRSNMFSYAYEMNHFKRFMD